MRSETDSGEIHILDKRLRTKRYGQQLINSLPPYRQQ
ncbi:helicase C-terminal domain-containing protein [Cobetia marina]|uniref:Helicase C-terminal domain-containing protein n=1 Tax=Cobetia marina TaxID=28258 RepID=A0ABU9GKP6_COBMA